MKKTKPASSQVEGRIAAVCHPETRHLCRLDFTTKNTIFNAMQTPIAFVDPGPSDLWIDAVSLAEMK